MEIYTGSTEKIKVKVQVPFTATSADVKAYDGDTVLHDFSQTVSEVDGYSVALPFWLVDNDKKFIIKWDLTYIDDDGAERHYRSSNEINVVTPYATVADIRDAIGPTETLYSDAQLARAERRVRGLIEAHTGQSFGRYEGTRTVVGAGDGQLKLPDRLVSINTLSGSNIITDASYYAVRGGGYYIGTTTPNLGDGDYVFTNVIRDPDSMYNNFTFRDNYVYTINGVWGWEAVPSDVKEAALLLIEDTLDPDSEYRERYGAIVRAADWSFEYHDKAYMGTGNATADRLLEPYKRWSMTVI